MRESLDGMAPLEALALGLSLGLGAGLTPGPMTALAVSTTLERGLRAGVQVACAPLVTDGPILLLALWVLRGLPAPVVAALATAGGLYLVWLGLRTARSAGRPRAGASASGRLAELRRAVAVNFLSPTPYLFWVGVGSPIVREAWTRSPLAAVAFLAPFFGLLVGSKVAVAWAVAAGGRRLSERGYQRAAQVAGYLLSGTGLLLAWRAFAGLGVV